MRHAPFDSEAIMPNNHQTTTATTQGDTMIITADTPQTTIKIQGILFSAPSPFVEGYALTKSEAAAQRRIEERQQLSGIVA
jgi:hypothetical protein